jgi:O-antigen ligase
MIGIDSTHDLVLLAISPQLLWVEALVLGLYLAFAMMNAWRYEADRAALLPKSRAAEWLGIGVLLAFWWVFTESLGMDQSLLAFELALALVLSVVHPTLAIGFFVVFLFLRPWEIVDPDAAAILALPRIYAILALVTSAIYLYRKRQWTLRFGTPVVLLGAFSLWVFLSTFARPDVGSAQDVYFEGFFKAVILFVLISQSIRDPRDFKMLKAALIFSALGISLVSIYRTLNTPDMYAARVGSFGLLADPNDISAVMVLVFPFAWMVLSNRRESRFLRFISLLTLISSGALLYYARSRGALLALLVTIAAMLILNFKNRRKAFLVAGLALLLFIPLSAGFKRSEADLSSSSESRIIYWKTSLLMVAHSPIFGVGFSGYPLEFEHYAPSFIESGVRTAHSSWFLALAETGFLGFALFLGLFLWAFRTSWNLRKIFPELFFATLGYGIAMSFLSHTYAIYFYILLGVVFVASRLPKTAALLLLVALVPHFIWGTQAQAGDEIAVEVIRGANKAIGRYVPPGASQLALKGSRGETLNFQLKLKTVGCAKLTFQSSVKAVTARFFEMPYIKTQHPSFPGAYVGSHHDPLPPLADGALCPSAPGAWGWVWGDLRIDSSVPAGDYTGVITIKTVESSRDVPVQLRVWKMQMPVAPAIPLYAEYSSWYGVLGHFGRTNPQEGALSAAYAEAMREHRIVPMKSWVKAPAVLSGGVVDLDENLGVHSSFREVVLDHHLDGSLFDFPRPFGASTAVETQYWKAVEQSILLNQFKGQAFVYLWDEPKKTDYPALFSLIQLVRKQAPDLKILVTTSGYDRMARMPEFEKEIDIFVPVMNDWGGTFKSPQMERYRELQAHGKQLWTYLRCMSHGCEGAVESGYPDWVLDRPSVWIRSMPWVLSQMHLDGFLYYDVDYAYQFYPKKDPWNDLWYFTGNGDGTLFYPGRPGEHGLRSHQPVDSIRVKVWREASFDAEYIRWMEKLASAPAWWKTKYHAIAQSPVEWSKNYGDYQALRDQAGEYLNSL